MKFKKKTFLFTLLLILFALSLYLVEWSPMGAQSIAQYNNGYGTFDMKAYSVTTIQSVLGQMQPEGFAAYNRYFMLDFFFVLTFGTLQISLLYMVYKRIPKKELRLLLYAVPLIRGICDIIENIFLMIILKQYPVVQEHFVSIASGATTIKLFMIKIWSLLFLAGIFINLLYKRKQKNI